MRSDSGIPRGCLLPAFRSLVVLAIVWTMVASLGYAKGWNQPIAYGLMCGALAALVSWTIDQQGWRQYVFDLPTTVVETVETERVVERTPILVYSNNGRTTQYSYTEHQDELELLCRGLLQGRPFTYRAWAGEIPDPVFSEFRQQFLSKGWAKNRYDSNPASGLVLTPAGLEAVQQIANPPTGMLNIYPNSMY